MTDVMCTPGDVTLVMVARARDQSYLPSLFTKLCRVLQSGFNLNCVDIFHVTAACIIDHQCFCR